jgi:hypothetical protein
MTVPLRAALYLRVPTARQAEHDVSIPDQKRRGEAYCQSRGYQLVETYVEPGASANRDCLAHYPFVVVRIACRVCSRRGCYRLARLAAKFGPEISLRDLTDWFSYGEPRRVAERANRLVASTCRTLGSHGRQTRRQGR